MAGLQGQGSQGLGVLRVRMERPHTRRHPERPKGGRRIQMALPHHRQGRHRLQAKAKTVAAVFLPKTGEVPGHPPWTGHHLQQRGLQETHGHHEDHPQRLEDDPMDHQGRGQDHPLRPRRRDGNKAAGEHLRHWQGGIQSILRRCPVDGTHHDGPQRGHRLETREQAQLRDRPKAGRPRLLLSDLRRGRRRHRPHPAQGSLRQDPSYGQGAGLRQRPLPQQERHTEPGADNGRHGTAARPHREARPHHGRHHHKRTLAAEETQRPYRRHGHAGSRRLTRPQCPGSPIPGNQRTATSSRHTTPYRPDSNAI